MKTSVVPLAVTISGEGEADSNKVTSEGGEFSDENRQERGGGTAVRGSLCQEAALEWSGELRD